MVAENLRVSQRILLVLALGTATPAAIALWSLGATRQSLHDARAAEVRHLVDAAWTLVGGFHDQAVRGNMPEAAAKDAARQAVRGLRYDGTNYFFVWDLNGNGIAHGGNPALEGRNFISGPDAVANPGVADMVQKLVTVARDQGEGFATYRIPKAGQATSIDKIGYSKLYPPWGWAIGTGAYVEDIDAAFWSRAWADMTLAACLMTLTGLLSYFLGYDLSSSLRGLTRAVEGLAGGHLDVRIPSGGRGDEVGVMARAMEVFKRNAIHAVAQGAELKRTGLRLETALNNMVQGLCVYDDEHRLQLYNHQFCRMINLSPSDLYPGMPLRELAEASFKAGNYPGQDLEAALLVRKASLQGRGPKTIVVELAGGRMASITHAPMPDGGWVGTYEDVTERQAAEARITYMARHDALTDLPNRLVLKERVAQALAETGRDRKSAVLCLDLDHFKRVNDTLGHPVGDALLVAAAERLSACVREGDTLARMGGDEFVIVQAGIDRAEDAGVLAERIIAEMGRPFILAEHQLSVGTSVGIALLPDDGRDEATVLKNADIALYRAKAEERGTFCFFEAGMDTRLHVRRQLEIDIREGIQRGEFALYYQPLVGLATGQVTGFEALLRWRHPERGMVSPGDFIPIAEETGLIVPLGEWVVRSACAEAASWPGTLKVAVNLSAVQFRSRNLVPTVARALRETGLAANRLELEITETLLLQDSDATLSMLHDLRALGTRIAMDDFGTGYSSLRYLRCFPFDKVKIDQSFIKDLSTRADSIHIVRAISGLCSGLGMSTTAEGVETVDQFEKVRSEGCTEVQGFLFSPPRPATEIPAILLKMRAMHTRMAAGVDRPVCWADPVAALA